MNGVMACNTHGKEGNVYGVLVIKSEGKGPLGRLRLR